MRQDDDRIKDEVEGALLDAEEHPQARVYTGPLGFDPVDGSLGDLEPLGFATLEDGTLEVDGDPDELLPLSGLGGGSVVIQIPNAEPLLVAYARSLVERLETDRALELVEQEIDRAAAKHGKQTDLQLVRPDGGRRAGYRELATWHRDDNDYRAVNGVLTWDTVLLEEVYEALAEAEGSEELGNELIQVAATAIRIWLAQRAKQIPDAQAVTILRQLMTVQAVA